MVTPRPFTKRGVYKSSRPRGGLYVAPARLPVDSQAMSTYLNNSNKFTIPVGSSSLRVAARRTRPADHPLASDVPAYGRTHPRTRRGAELFTSPQLIDPASISGNPTRSTCVTPGVAAAKLSVQHPASMSSLKRKSAPPAKAERKIKRTRFGQVELPAQELRDKDAHDNSKKGDNKVTQHGGHISLTWSRTSLTG